MKPAAIFTHNDLVGVARGWLKRPKQGQYGGAVVRRGACCVVVSEISGGEEPDALGWHGTATTLIECKTSRSDFLADRKKHSRRFLQQGLGDYRFYLTAADAGVILSVNELPTGFGWLEVSRTPRGKVIVSIKHEAQTQPAKYQTRETMILLSLLRRIGSQSPKGVSIQCYAYETKNRTVMEVLSESAV